MLNIQAEHIDWNQWTIERIDFDTLYHLWVIAKPRAIRWESEMLREAFQRRHTACYGPESWRDIVRHRIITLRRLRCELEEYKRELDRRTT